LSGEAVGDGEFRGGAGDDGDYFGHVLLEIARAENMMQQQRWQWRWQ